MSVFAGNSFRKVMIAASFPFRFNTILPVSRQIAILSWSASCRIEIYTLINSVHPLNWIQTGIVLRMMQPDIIVYDTGCR